jgi:hypothetical protein
MRSAQCYFNGIDAQLPFEQRMQKLFRNIACYKMKHFEVSAFLEQSYHSPYVDVIDLKKKQKAMEPLHALIKEGIETKKIKNIETRLLVSYLFGIVNEIVKRAYFSNKKLTDADIEEVYAMFWDGISYSAK